MIGSSLSRGISRPHENSMFVRSGRLDAAPPLDIPRGEGTGASGVPVYWSGLEEEKS